jgi:beta-glucosidase
VFAPGVELENFSGCFKATFTPKEAGEITLSLEADDGYRFIVNGDTLRDRFRQAHGVQKQSKTYKVKPGQKYDIQIDFIQLFGMAHMQFDIYHKQEMSQQEIINQIGDADYVVFVGGISPSLEGEEMKVDAYGFKGGDRTDIQLPQCQRDLIKAIHDAGKKVIYVNCSGSAIALVPETETCEAIMQAWYPGEKGGDAVADVIFGDYNPSGKLPITFYRSVEDLPDFLDYTMKNRTYRYFNGNPLWHFGYGMSYTSFEFGKPKYKQGKLTVDVKNSGKFDGDEVVQVYIRRIDDVNGPIKTLKAFKRITLKAGEKQNICIDMPRESFEVWDAETNTMRVVSGKYEVMVGNSSRAEDLKTITVKI